MHFIFLRVRQIILLIHSLYPLFLVLMFPFLPFQVREQADGGKVDKVARLVTFNCPGVNNYILVEAFTKCNFDVWVSKKHAWGYFHFCFLFFSFFFFFLRAAHSTAQLYLGTYLAVPVRLWRGQFNLWWQRWWNECCLAKGSGGKYVNTWKNKNGY